jgi:hypothetical protein
MGLQKDIEITPIGITLTNAYFKITAINIIWEKKLVNITIKCYKTREDSVSNISEVKSSLFSLAGDDVETWFGDTAMQEAGANIRSKAYEWLKTQDFFETALDVIEE